MGHRAYLAIALGATTCLASHAAGAQGLLPDFGTDIRVGDLRNQFSRAFGDNPKGAVGRVFTVSKAIDVTETYSSSVIGARRRGGDLTTMISPSINIEADTDLVRGTFSYKPMASLYMNNANMNNIAHNLNADLSSTLIDDLLFIDLRGYAAVQPIVTSFGTTGGNGGPANETQTALFSASPYLQHHFGETLTARLGYTIARTVIESMQPRGQAPLISGLNGNYTSHEQNLSLTTGPDFGRWSGGLQASATQYEGGGIYRGYHTERITTNYGYAVSRIMTATASVGYESITYGQSVLLPPIRGVTWSGGVQLTPNADSQIKISYGRQQGMTSASLDGNYAITSRITLGARYSQSIGSGLQNLQTALSHSSVGPGGISIDPVTGAPVSLRGLLNQQPGIYKTSATSLSAAWLLTRDLFSFDISSTQRSLLAGTPAGGATAGIGSNSGLSSSASWNHTVSEALNTTGSVQFSTQTVPIGGVTNDSQNVTVSLSAQYIMSETLSGNALIAHSFSKGQTFGFAPPRDTAVVGIHKAF